MKSSLDSLRSFAALQQTARMGWWQFNLDRKEIQFSSFLVELMGLSSDTLTADQYRQYLHPDGRYEVITQLQNLYLNGTDPDDYLLHTTRGYVRMHTITGEQTLNAQGEKILEGVLQCIEEGASERTGLITGEDREAHHQLDRLLNWQKSITQNLLGLLDTTDNQEVIQRMLDMILEHFGASHAYVFSFDYSRQTFNCVYESARSDREPALGRLQGISILEKRECVTPLLEKNSVFLDDIHDTDGNCVLFEAQGVISSMAAPLLSGEGVWGFIRVDISDQKRAWSYLDRESFRAVTNVIGVCLALSRSEEQAVQHSEFLHLLYQNMPLGYFRLRIDLNQAGDVIDYEYLDVNHMFLEIMGMSREQIIGKMHTEIGPIYVNKLDLNILKQVAYEGKIHETRGQFRTNSRYYNTTIYSPRRGDVVALFFDVTDLLATTEALRRNEEELKKVYTNIPLGIEIYDKDGYMIDVNDQEVEIQRVPSKETLLGLNLFEHPSLPRFAYDLLKDGKDVTFEVSVDGMKVNRQYYGVDSLEMLRYLTIKATVLYNSKGEVENYLLIIIDNTEIYQASLRLQEFESVFNAVAEIAEVGFFRWNLLGNQYLNSDQWYRNMGFEQQEGVQLSYDDYEDRIHPEDAANLRKFIVGAMAGTQTKITAEFRVRDGQDWKWLRTTAHVTQYEPENNLVNVIGINYNISELKRTEQNLIEAKAKAEESDRLKSAFLANMSHEIRTPLNAIVGFSNILTETEDPEEKQAYIAIINKNNEHLLGLISDILDLSKIESGNMDVSIDKIRPDELTEQAVDSFLLRVPQGVELRVFPCEGGSDVVIRSDMQRLSQVLGNFIGNAIKFTAKGHIWVASRLSEDGRQVEFWVEDTGVGMDPEKAKLVFERFVKLNDFIPGTGLGLPICQSIIDRLGGEIGVESQLGVGSRFWFTVPVQGPPAA